MEGTQEVEESLHDEDFKPAHLQVVQSEVTSMTTRSQQEQKAGGFKVEQMPCNSLEAEHQTLQREHRELQAEHKRLLAEHERLKQEHGTFLAEREKLLAEHETLQAEHTTLQVEHTRLQVEHTTLQVEHTRLQAEIQTVLLEKEVLRKAVEVAESVVRQTSVANGKSREIVIERGDRGDCNGMKIEKLQLRETAPCLVNPTKVKKIQAKSTNCKHKAMKLNSQSLDQHQEATSSLRTGRKRKRRSSISVDFVQSATPQTQAFRTERKKPCMTLDTAVASYGVRPSSSPELTEEEDLKDLEISFDLSSVSSDIGGRPSAVVPGVRSSEGNVDGLDKTGGEEDRGLTNGHVVQTSDLSDEETSTKSCRSRSVTLYKCEDCDRSFRSNGQYDSHRQTHHGGIQTHRCPRCRNVFPSANLLVEHMLTHITSPAHHRQSHTCSHCSLRFSSNTALRKHIHRSHNKKVKVKRKPLPGKEFRCRTCGETFAKNSELSVHMRVHSDGKPFKCSECKAAFTTQSNLAAHARKHSGDKPYCCNECDATFPRSADLKSHVRRHSSVKPHLCSKCPAAFCRAGDLKPHMRTHTGEKPFQCEECGAAFTTSSNLAVHRRTHTGERPFQCEQCGAAFTQLGHLTRHRSQHATENDFRCPVCPAAFGNKYKLKVHMQRHNTDNTFKCHKCGAAFSRASVLTEHLRIHTGEKPYKCSHCPASFARSANLMAHRRKHTGERPYVCPHCKQGFTQSTSLNRHLQSQKACLARQGLPKSNTDPTTTQGEYSESKASPFEDGRREEEPASEMGQGRALTSTNQEAGKVEMLGSESGGVLQKQHAGGVIGADADRNAFPSSSEAFPGDVQLSSTTLASSQAQTLCNIRKYESIGVEDRATDAERHREEQGSCLTPRGQCSFSNGSGDCPSFQPPAVSLSKAVYSNTGVCGGDLSPPSNLSPFHQLAPNALTEPAAYSDALPAAASLPRHSRGREGTAASFGMTSSRCEATLETVLLPPISTMADFQTDLSGLGSSLTALRNLTPQPNTYLHPHVGMSAPPPPSRVSPPHRQMPNS